MEETNERFYAFIDNVTLSFPATYSQFLEIMDLTMTDKEDSKYFSDTFETKGKYLTSNDCETNEGRLICFTIIRA